MGAARSGPREDVPATTCLPLTHCQNQSGERGLPHARSPCETQQQTEDNSGLTGIAFGGPQCRH